MGKKSKKEIAIMQKGGEKLARIRKRLVRQVKQGVTSEMIDHLAEALIAKEKGVPSFKKIAGYRWATCICPNEVVVHGVPNNKPFRAGDVVGIDIGFYYQGFHTDSAETVLVRSCNNQSRAMKQKEKFLKVGEKALRLAIKQAISGNYIGHISQAIQKTVEEQGFNIIKNLVGHGIGKELHEEPEVPGFLKMPIEETPRLEEGMTLAIEVIYCRGKPDVIINSDDRWSVITKDKSISGLFEHTVLVGKVSPLVLTK